MDSIDSILSSTQPLPKDAPEPLPQADTPDGWWRMAGLSGTRDGVTKAVQASNAPDYWKSAIVAQIGVIPEVFNMIKLDAHFTLDSGVSQLILTIKPATGLV